MGDFPTKKKNTIFLFSVKKYFCFEVKLFGSVSKILKNKIKFINYLDITLSWVEPHNNTYL
jgi:hypothetical protein